MILQCEGRNIIVYGQVFGRFFFRKLRFLGKSLRKCVTSSEESGLILP